MLSAATSLFRRKRSVGISEICKFALKSIAFKNQYGNNIWGSFWGNNKFFFWKEMYRIYFLLKIKYFWGYLWLYYPLLLHFETCYTLTFDFSAMSDLKKCRFRHQHFVFSNKENIWQKTSFLWRPFLFCIYDEKMHFKQLIYK